MALGASQWARFTKEAAWGTFDGSASVVFWVRLTAGNSLTLGGTPATWDVRGADGFNLRQQRGTQRTSFGGALNTVLYPTQAINLVPWAFKPTANVLDSYTIDYFDGIEPRRYLGCRAASATIRSSTQGDVLTYQVQIVAQTDDPTFTTLAQPAATVFPSERPYVHQDSAGFVSVGSTVVGYDSMEVSVQNKLDARFFESSRVVNCDYNGRDVNFALTELIRDNTRRVAYEAQTPYAATIKWATGGHLVQFAFQSANFLGNRTPDRNFDKSQDEALNFMAYKDSSTGVDVVTTAS